jgi:hypothetical protein
MRTWKQQKEATVFETWANAPLYDVVSCGSEECEEYDDCNCVPPKRGTFINQFVKLYLEPWLVKNKYTLGKNLKQFPNIMLHWWFFQKKEFNLKKPRSKLNIKHRNLPLDYDTFFHMLDNSDFNEFLISTSTYEFCDNSPLGLHIYHEIKPFIYNYLDIDASLATEEINAILQEIKDEIDRMKLLTKTNQYDYDQSDLGYYKGNRIMST